MRAVILTNVCLCVPPLQGDSNLGGSDNPKKVESTSSSNYRLVKEVSSAPGPASVGTPAGVINQCLCA